MVLRNWGKGGLDLQQPSHMNDDSAYQRLLRETESGTYSTGWGKLPVGDISFNRQRNVSEVGDVCMQHSAGIAPDGEAQAAHAANAHTHTLGLLACKRVY